MMGIPLTHNDDRGIQWQNVGLVFRISSTFLTGQIPGSMTSLYTMFPRSELSIIVRIFFMLAFKSTTVGLRCWRREKVSN